MGAVSTATVLKPRRTSRALLSSSSPRPLIIIDTNERRGRLGAKSIGFSFERSTLGLPLFDDTNTPLVGLFRRLGPGLLRIGGSSVDRNPWTNTGSGRTNGVVSRPDIVALRRFVDATAWDVLYGVPFVNADPSLTQSPSTEVNAVSTILDRRLAAYEIGNEPDLYSSMPAFAPLAGTLNLCTSRWNSFAHAIREVDATTPLSGPGCALLQTIPSFTIPFTRATDGKLAWVTQHYYRGFGGTGQSIALLLAPDPLLAPSLTTLLAASADVHATQVRITETNSFASGGQPGVSNSFASALWAISHHLDCTTLGVAGLNFHNSGNGLGYPAIAQLNGTVTQVRPLYYGLLFLALLGTGSHVACSTRDLPSSTRVHAVAGDDGVLRVALSNRDGSLPITLDVDCGLPIAQASLQRLEAPGLDATSDVKLAGAAVSIDGSWDPTEREDVVVSGTTLTVTLHAPSAAIVEIHFAHHAPTPTTANTSAPPSTSNHVAPPAQPSVVVPNYTG